MVGNPLTPQQFAAKWRGVQLSERASVQEHFLDLCALFGQPTPASADPAGTRYTFEKGVTKTGGGQGFADVWKRGYFAWEYKKKRRDLAAAYGQLLLYREPLENPPLLVVCDTERDEVHTNFTNTAAHVYRFGNDDLTEAGPRRILRAVFARPDDLRPGQTVAQVTEEAARRFAALADGLRAHRVPPAEAAHFLTQLLFCLFAEDVGLLPRDSFGDVVRRALPRPASFLRNLTAPFETMRDGGEFPLQDIDRFNGGLFAANAPFYLTHRELLTLAEAAALNWSSMDTAIIRKHLDFVLCDVGTLRPTLAIELDDRSHERADRRERDAFVDQVLADVGLPLVRVPVERSYDPRALAATLTEARARNEATATASGLVDGPGEMCPRCAGKLERRVARQGPRAGESFLGCSNYPRCRYTAPLV